MVDSCRAPAFPRALPMEVRRAQKVGKSGDNSSLTIIFIIFLRQPRIYIYINKIKYEKKPAAGVFFLDMW
jgi:hypothetical protein